MSWRCACGVKNYEFVDSCYVCSEERLYEAFECMACGFHATFDGMIVAHQAVCAEMEPEKRENRKVMVGFLFSEDHYDQVLELARKATLDQGKQTAD